MATSVCMNIWGGHEIRWEGRSGSRSTGRAVETPGHGPGHGRCAGGCLWILKKTEQAAFLRPLCQPVLPSFISIHRDLRQYSNPLGEAEPLK